MSKRSEEKAGKKIESLYFKQAINYENTEFIFELNDSPTSDDLNITVLINRTIHGNYAISKIMAGCIEYLSHTEFYINLDRSTMQDTVAKKEYGRDGNLIFSKGVVKGPANIAKFLNYFVQNNIVSEDSTQVTLLVKRINQLTSSNSLSAADLLAPPPKSICLTM